MNNQERLMWLDAINKCMEQKEYGSVVKCALCKVVNKVRLYQPCENCICCAFVKFLGTKIESVHDDACSLLMEYFYPELLEDVPSNNFGDVTKCRNVLTNMKVWLGGLG